MSRKLLLLDSTKPHVILVKKIDCAPCFFKCPDECKNSSKDDVSYTPFSPPPSSGSSQKSHMPTILILMLCILGAAFVFLCYLTIRRRYRSNSSSRRRNDNVTEDFIDENHGPNMVIHPIWYINTVGLEQSVIDSIAVFKYKKSDGLIEGVDCSVCLSEFQDDDNLRLLPKCSHAFHIDCIDTWLRSHKNCPLCRAPVVRENVQESGESVLNNSGSLEVENTSPNDQPERNEVRDDVENIGHSPNCEAKILEMLKKNSRIRVLSDLVDRRVRLDEELEPVRRSISIDAAYGSTIYASMAKIHQEGCSKVQEMEMEKQNSVKDSKAPGGDTKLIIHHKPRKSFSFGRSLQKMPIRMKRSFSSSSKSSLPRHSRSQELVQAI